MGHPFLAGFEPGENGLRNIEAEEYDEGWELLRPIAHPVAQPTPGPQGTVPADWEWQLH
ncbi:hypothetical protein AB0N06_36030 [Streptomyces sp. NPDC051020]|uniref:hypothetical protein n=1 Tax=Streptomyces sp. NPDC051020 TaxID=3155409 RepID=UPI003432E111